MVAILGYLLFGIVVFEIARLIGSILHFHQIFYYILKKIKEVIYNIKKDPQ